MKSANSRGARPPQWSTVGWIVALIVLLAVVDVLTGYELGFFVFYYVPIALAGWHCRRWVVVGLAVLCAVVWLGCDLWTRHLYSSPFFQIWNMLIRLAAFLTVGLIISKFRESSERQRLLSSQLATALSEVKELKGLLPMCAWCKQVRNDQGYWEQIEAYLATRTRAEFTHSVCPDCARRVMAQQAV